MKRRVFLAGSMGMASALPVIAQDYGLAAPATLNMC